MEADGVTGATYLYGVFRPPPGPGEDLFRGLAAIEDGCAVGAISSGRLAVAASPVPRSVYNQESLTALSRDLDWLALRATRHEQVIRRLMPSRDVIPLKFGTLCDTEASAAGLLARRASEFTSWLDRVAGREEWGVHVYADAARLGAVWERTAEAMQSLDREIASAPGGQAWLLAKKRRKLAADGTREAAAALAEQVLAGLAAEESQPARLPAAGPTASDMVVLSAALLVKRTRRCGLQVEAEALEARFAEYGMRIELSGPWAPYHFAGV